MSTDASGWVGWTLFAAVIMMLVGAFHVIQGLVALFKDEYYAVGASGLVLNVRLHGVGLDPHRGRRDCRGRRDRVAQRQDVGAGPRHRDGHS